MESYDVVVIGGGPAGLAAATTASRQGAHVLLLEREGKLGGILKQCIHDGFGIQRYHAKLSGPEYAAREIDALSSTGCEISLLTFVTAIRRHDEIFDLDMITRQGIRHVQAKRLIFATGCRERTSRQVAIHGTNPAGVFTAGSAQYYINILGKMPTKRCVILGSGDIGLIMARRLTLEGASVEGVYEIKATPSGLSRNIAQCLDDFNIPLHLSHTVTRVFGNDRLEAVEVAEVDAHMAPIASTRRIIACDALILSVGLMPENELAEALHIPLNPRTKGPYADQQMMTLVEGAFSCGNALHVNDLADYVSETGEIAGAAAAHLTPTVRALVPVGFSEGLSYVVPSHIDTLGPLAPVIFYFRSQDTYENKTLRLLVNDKEIFKKRYTHLRPPEMERIEVPLSTIGDIRTIAFVLEDTR